MELITRGSEEYVSLKDILSQVCKPVRWLYLRLEKSKAIKIKNASTGKDYLVFSVGLVIDLFKKSAINGDPFSYAGLLEIKKQTRIYQQELEGVEKLDPQKNLLTWFDQLEPGEYNRDTLREVYNDWCSERLNTKVDVNRTSFARLLERAKAHKDLPIKKVYRSINGQAGRVYLVGDK